MKLAAQMSIYIEEWLISSKNTSQDTSANCRPTSVVPVFVSKWIK